MLILIYKAYKIINTKNNIPYTYTYTYTYNLKK